MLLVLGVLIPEELGFWLNLELARLHGLRLDVLFSSVYVIFQHADRRLHSTPSSNVRKCSHGPTGSAEASTGRRPDLGKRQEGSGIGFSCLD